MLLEDFYLWINRVFQWRVSLPHVPVHHERHDPNHLQREALAAHWLLPSRPPADFARLLTPDAAAKTLNRVAFLRRRRG